MTAVPRLLLIDANVWVNNYAGAQDQASEARLLIDHCLDRGIGLLYAVHSAKDVYYALRSYAKRAVRAEGRPLDDAAARAIEEIAWRCVLNMRELAAAVGADESDLWLAERFHGLHPDLEDDLVIAAVERSRADFLVTFDERLIRRAPVAALTPADVLALLDGLGQPGVSDGAGEPEPR